LRIPDNVNQLCMASRYRHNGRVGRFVPLVVALLAVAGCGGASKSTPQTGPAPVHQAETARPPLVSIFEAPAQLVDAPGPTLDDLRRLGVDYVRVMVPWSGVAPASAAPSNPASPASYPASAWSVYDSIITGAAARGLGVNLDPTAPAPQWALSPGAPTGAPPGIWKPSASAFGQFVRAVATRYSGHYTPPGASSPLPRVSLWSVWNEPNYGVELAPQAIDNSTVEISPALYRGLLDAAWTALRGTGHGHDTILIGEIAPRGITGPGYPGNFSGMVPLRFVRALYCVDSSLNPLSGSAAKARGCPATAAASKRFVTENPALFSASGFAVHPYTQGALAPNVRTPGEPGYADLASLTELEQMLDTITSHYGHSYEFSFYSTEYGYKTNPPYGGGAPLQTAASYLNWAEYMSWRDPRIRAWDQYLLTDPPPTGPSQFVTGLEFANGTPKPSLAAWRLPIWLPQERAGRGTPLEVWGCLRPATKATGPGARGGTIEFRPSGAPGFRTIRRVTATPRSCYFDVKVSFPSSGAVRLAWKYPQGPVVHSRQVQVSVS
jgi:hypothetical protein